MGQGQTPERILSAALDLFNRFGEPNVTTNRIADELEISPGNLHYHFRTKQSLIDELFARFEQRMLELLSVPEQRIPDLEDVWLFLHLAFEIIAEYRFLYRDLTELCARNRRLHQRFRALLKLSIETADALCLGLVERGHMQIDPEERTVLARNIVLICSYWVAFDQVLDSDQEPRPERAAWQVISLVSPYLRGPARSQMKALGEAYLT